MTKPSKFAEDILAGGAGRSKFLFISPASRADVDQD
jgi:hypothetical protein